MISVRLFTKGTVEKGGLAKASALSKLVWINAVDPSLSDLKHIAEKVRLPIHHLKLGLDENEPPKLIENEASYIILRSPCVIDKDMQVSSFLVVLYRNYIITIAKNEIESIKEVHELPSDELALIMKDSSENVLSLILTKVIKHYFNVLDSIEDKTEILEENVVLNSENKMLKDVFELRKVLIYFLKGATGNREVLASIITEKSKHIGKKFINQFKDNYHETIQVVEMAHTHRDILASIIDVSMSVASNRMNNVMKKFTVVASLVLVPTLISGIYGMNFLYMPELKWKYGYLFALGLMVVTVIIMLYYFSRKGWMK